VDKWQHRTTPPPQADILPTVWHFPERWMPPMPTNYITLTRQELYYMVWSEPMSSLANTFGTSDVALAKRCRAADVPIPYSDTGARKTAGQEPPACTAQHK